MFRRSRLAVALVPLLLASMVAFAFVAPVAAEEAGEGQGLAASFAFQPPAPVTPSGKPDLTIVDVTYAPRLPKIGEVLTFSINVQNIGAAGSGAVALELSTDSTKLKENLASLAPAAIRTVVMQSRLNASGQIFKFVVDPENAVAEVLENNNTQQLCVGGKATRPADEKIVELCFIHSLSQAQIFPGEVAVKLGTKLRIYNVTDDKVPHDPVVIIDAKTKVAMFVPGFRVEPGKVKEIEFVADREGEYLITHERHGHALTAKLIVQK